MQRVGLASFVSGASPYLVLASPFHAGGPLHRRELVFTPRLKRQHREHAMAGSITPTHHCEESLFIQKIAPRIAPALPELVGAELQKCCPPCRIFSWSFNHRGLVQESIGHFVAARQVTSRPIAITCRERKWNVDENNYSSALHSIAYCLIPGYTIFLNFTMI